MIAVFIHMDIKVQDGEVQKHLDALNEALAGANLMLFHQLATEPLLRRRARERFASEGDAVSGPWEQLKESTSDIREHAGFSRDHPINKRTGGLEGWITRGSNEFTVGGDWAAFFMPGRTNDRALRGKLERAQKGAPAGHPMPFGWGKGLGTKPSPSPTPPRPVIGLDAVDLAHTMSALQIWIAGEVAKRV